MVWVMAMFQDLDCKLPGLQGWSEFHTCIVCNSSRPYLDILGMIARDILILLAACRLNLRIREQMQCTAGLEQQSV